MHSLSDLVKVRFSWQQEEAQTEFWKTTIDLQGNDSIMQHMDVALVIAKGGCSSIFLPSLDTNGISFPWDTTFGVICCAQELVLLSAPQRKDWNDKTCKDKGLAAPKTFRACFVPGSVRNALQHQGLSYFLCVFVALKGWGRMASQVHSDKQIYNHSVARKNFFFGQMAV